MGVVTDAVGGVAQQPAPQFRVVAVANDNQVVGAFSRNFYDLLGGMTAAGFAGDAQAVLRGHFLHFPLPLLEVFVRCFGLALGLAGQVRVAWQS